jgi:hypothetical protein
VAVSDSKSGSGKRCVAVNWRVLLPGPLSTVPEGASTSTTLHHPRRTCAFWSSQVQSTLFQFELGRKTDHKKKSSETQKYPSCVSHFKDVKGQHGV